MPDHIKKLKKVLKKCKDVFLGKKKKSNLLEGQNAHGTDEEVNNDLPRDVLDTPSLSESHVTSLAENRKLNKLMRNISILRPKRTQKNRFRVLKESGARFKFKNLFRGKTRKISKRDSSLRELYSLISTSPFTKIFFLADLSQFEELTSDSTRIQRRVMQNYGCPFRRNAVSRRRKNSTSSIKISISDTSILQDRTALDIEILNGIRYPKFIPILEPSDQFHPISAVDKIFPRCWIDVQAWYDGWTKLGYQAEVDPSEIEESAGKRQSEESLFTDIKQSLSDSMLQDDEVKSGLCRSLFLDKDNKNAHFRWKDNKINIRKADFEQSFNQDESDKRSVLLERRERPHARSRRQQKFIYKNHPMAERLCRINLDHFRLVAKLAEEKVCIKRQYFNLNEKPYTELYIEAKGGRYANISLCHLKTEMAHACLKSFFFPCPDVANVMWIKDLGARILQNIFINEGIVCDVFQRSVKAADTVKFQAVIFLSKGAAILLKHRHVCFLDTLSVCLGMEKENILLIDIGYKPSDVI